MNTNSISQYIREITASPVFSLFGLFIGLFGIFLAFVFYYRTKQNKKFSFTHRSVWIFKDSSPLMLKLHVLYNGKKTRNLSITQVAFWNAGNGTIKYEDFAPTDPLRIEILDGEILDAEILYVTQVANDVNVYSVKDGVALIKVGFFDPQHGAVIRVVHTGKLRRNIKFSGTVMGFGSPKLLFEKSAYYFRRIMWMPWRMSLRKQKWTMAFVVLIITIFSIAVLCMDPVSNEKISNSPWRFALLIGIAPYWILVAGAFRRQIPKDIDDYIEEFGVNKK